VTTTEEYEHAVAGTLGNAVQMRLLFRLVTDVRLLFGLAVLLFFCFSFF
jgi:hypothetical protein